MPAFQLVPEVKLGDLLTAVSVLIGSLSLTYAVLKDRTLRKREYADRIRKAAADTLVAMDRWFEIASRYFRDAQPLLTEIDVQLVTTQDVTQTRDALWKGLVQLEATITSRILAENLDGAYAGLYGYSPEIHRLYKDTMLELKDLFESAHIDHLKQSQHDVMKMRSTKTPYISAQLGNELREGTADAATRFVRSAQAVVIDLQGQLLNLAHAKDAEIYTKAVLLRGRSAP